MKWFVLKQEAENFNSGTGSEFAKTPSTARKFTLCSAAKAEKPDTEDRQFEVRNGSQSAQREISPRLLGVQKNALLQKGLPERPATALLARRPISFSFRPVSPQGRDFANLVTGSAIVLYQ
jgi:hypothetical protein